MPDETPDAAQDGSGRPVGERRPSSEVYRLLGALADRVEQLEAERAESRRRLEVIREALTTMANDDTQLPAARHIASVVGRRLAWIQGRSDER